MNTSKIMFMNLAFLVIFSLLVFLAGINETARFETFNIVEDDVINKSFLGNDTWDDYQEFKGSYIFTNDPFIKVLNFIGLIGILYLTLYAWRSGRKAPHMGLGAIFTSFNLLMIFMVYIGTTIFDYLKDIFLDQLILQLYSSIYSATYMYSLYVEWFVFFMLFSYFLMWFANELKYIDEIKKP